MLPPPGVDVYLANMDNAFVVDVERTTGIHTIHADPDVYTADLATIASYPSMHRERREAESGESEEDDGVNTTGANYDLRMVHARDINTFVTLENTNTILVIKNVQSRLVITLPSHIHDLKKSMFYIILHGRGSQSSNTTNGLLFFRQDQPHIDLFVFFSVFFSSFFLFLDLCVLIWKIKQAFDLQRSRHRRQLEMACMASRPFARAHIVLAEDCVPVYETQSLLTRRKTSNHRLKKHSLGVTNMAFTRTNSEEIFRVNPIALEPTEDGIAAVGTFVLELPGGHKAPAQACLGSTLLTMRVMYPSVQHGIQAPKPHRTERQTSVTCPSGHSGTI